MSNKQKFIAVAGEIDHTIYERSFSGRMTKGRYKIIDRFCRKNSQDIPYCGHEHDCCGCLCTQHASFSYQHNQVTISLYRGYNY